MLVYRIDGTKKEKLAHKRYDSHEPSEIKDITFN